MGYSPTRVVGAPRDKIDSPANQKKNVVKKIGTIFHDANKIGTYPPDWNECEEYDGHDNFDCNDVDRTRIVRSDEWIQKELDRIVKWYRDASKSYKSDTGGGSGSSSRFTTWKERENKEFYHWGRQQGLLLTYMYMMDRPLNFLLDKVPEQLPSSMQVDGNTRAKSSGNSTSNSSVLNNAIEKNQAMLEGQGEIQKKLLKVLEDTAGGTPKNNLDDRLKVLRGVRECDVFLAEIEKDEDRRKQQRRAHNNDSDEESIDSDAERERKERVEKKRRKYLELQDYFLDS